MLPILVITQAVGSAAALALTTECLEVTEAVMVDYTNYGRAFTAQWQSHRGFMLVEDDVVPWPGGMAELDACAEDWCAFQHPRGHVNFETGSGMAVGLGCMKFSTALVGRYSDSPVWAERGWDELDGAVNAMLESAGEVCHLHYPPAAHVKEQVLTLRRSFLPAGAG